MLGIRLGTGVGALGAGVRGVVLRGVAGREEGVRGVVTPRGGVLRGVADRDLGIGGVAVRGVPARGILGGV